MSKTRHSFIIFCRFRSLSQFFWQNLARISSSPESKNWRLCNDLAYKALSILVLSPTLPAQQLISCTLQLSPLHTVLPAVSNILSMFLSQCLCNCCSLYLEHSSTRYPQSLHPQLLRCLLTNPFLRRLFMLDFWS